MSTSRIPIVGDAPGEVLAVDGITISEQISRSGLLREGLNDLAGRLDCGGMIRDVEVEEFAAVMAEAAEDEEQADGEGGDHEEVDGDDVSGMSGEKDAPRGRGPRRSSVHVLGDREFGDVVAEAGQFRLDASAAPGRIIRAIRWIRWRISASSFGRPTRFAWTAIASRAGSLGGARRGLSRAER